MPSLPLCGDPCARRNPVASSMRNMFRWSLARSDSMGVSSSFSLLAFACPGWLMASNHGGNPKVCWTVHTTRIPVVSCWIIWMSVYRVVYRGIVKDINISGLISGYRVGYRCKKTITMDIGVSGCITGYFVKYCDNVIAGYRAWYQNIGISGYRAGYRDIKILRKRMPSIYRL